MSIFIIFNCRVLFSTYVSTLCWLIPDISFFLEIDANQVITRRWISFIL
jgi:hypothetical protein